MSEDTSWIVKGAEVAVYNDRPGIPLRLTSTTITKVNKRTFRVEGEENPFKIDDQIEETAGYYGKRVVQVDSDKHRELELRSRIEDAEHALDSAHAAWRRDRSNLPLLNRLTETTLRLAALMRTNREHLVTS